MTVWRDRTVAVVLPTYNEKDSIRSVIAGFERLGMVDEIVVVNNNAAAGTSDEVARTSAREVHEPRQGYGAAIRRGLREATADLVCVCEPDGTFDPEDLYKLLAYSTNFDIVYGSRTVPEFIWDGANMGWFLRWGNWAVAKMMEVLFNTVSLSDIGCTMRLLRRDASLRLLPHYRVDGSTFGPEMMLLSLLANERVIQIPVNYHPRVGASSVTGDHVVAFKLGLRMIVMVLSFWARRKRLAMKVRRDR
jgi:glycosyltransferase involved in cell wall biosynthesis